METKANTSFKPFLPAFLGLLLAGLLGLVLVTTLTLPRLGPRWLFFFCLVLFISALILPLSFVLNMRFPSTPPAQAKVIIRQAMWASVFLALLTWLQMGRILTIPLAIVLGAAFILIEFLLRLWEQSRWKPQQPSQ